MKRGTGIIPDPFCITRQRPQILNKYIAYVDFIIMYSAAFSNNLLHAEHTHCRNTSTKTSLQGTDTNRIDIQKISMFAE